MMIINTELKAGEDLFVLIQKIFGKCSSLEHVFLPDGFKKFVSAILEKKKNWQERSSEYGLQMSLVWISKPVISLIKEDAMSQSVFY